MSLSALLSLGLTAAALDRQFFLARQTWRLSSRLAALSYALYLSHGLTLDFWTAATRRLGVEQPKRLGYTLNITDADRVA
jgi:peptidoglycan/LPS O-acetylase OafA/YrhL